MKKYIYNILLLIAVLYSCNDDTAKQPTPSPEPPGISVAGSFSSQTLMHFDSARIRLFFAQYPQLDTFQPIVSQFYQNRDYAYAWFDSSRLTEQAFNLFNRVINLDQEGLPDSIPYKQVLTSMIEQEPDTATAPDLDIMLTAQYFLFGKKVYEGLPEAQTQAIDWHLPRKKIALDTLLDSLLKAPQSSLLSNEPQYRQYDLLKKFLARYREIAPKADSILIEPDKKVYRKGDSAAVLASIREKLFLLGDLSGNDSSMIFDTGLEQGVIKFQERHGLEPDGVIGSSFLSAIKVPVRKRIEQIMVNMERCRWVPAKIEGEYLLVNIPDFRLYAFDHDALLWDMKVVVGQSLRKTVVFNGNITYIVFSPYWNIPPGILKREILPAMKKDSNYLKKHDMEIAGTRDGLPIIRQRPGVTNPLGLVKFMFPNNYNIYMHDSPAKSLFDRNVRTFSHGCIRVADAEKMAAFLLKDQPEWTTVEIMEAMHTGKEKYVTLNNPMPVYIAYFTAWVDRNGEIQFRDDIYKRDKDIAEMLFAKR